MIVIAERIIRIFGRRLRDRNSQVCTGIIRSFCRLHIILPVARLGHNVLLRIVQGRAGLICLLYVKIGALGGSSSAFGYRDQLIIFLVHHAIGVQRAHSGLLAIHIDRLGGAVGEQQLGLPNLVCTRRSCSGFGGDNVLIQHGADIVAIHDEQVTVDFHKAVGIFQRDAGDGDHLVQQTAIVLRVAQGHQPVGCVQAVGHVRLDLQNSVGVHTGGSVLAGNRHDIAVPLHSAVDNDVGILHLVGRVALQTQAAQDIRILRIGIYGHAGIVPGNHVGPEGISHHIGGLQDRIGIDNDHIDVAAAILVDAGKGILIVDGVSGASTGEAPETLLAILVIAAGDAPEGIPILGRVVQAVGLAIDLNGVEVVVFVSHVADIANVGAYHNAALVDPDQQRLVVLGQHGHIHGEESREVLGGGVLLAINGVGVLFGVHVVINGSQDTLHGVCVVDLLQQGLAPLNGTGGIGQILHCLGLKRIPEHLSSVITGQRSRHVHIL